MQVLKPLEISSMSICPKEYFKGRRIFEVSLGSIRAAVSTVWSIEVYYVGIVMVNFLSLASLCNNLTAPSAAYVEHLIIRV